MTHEQRLEQEIMDIINKATNERWVFESARNQISFEVAALIRSRLKEVAEKAHLHAAYNTWLVVNGKLTEDDFLSRKQQFLSQYNQQP